MEDQIAKLIEMMQGMSPDGSRIWVDMIARKSLDAWVSMFMLPLVLAFLWTAGVICHKKAEKLDRYDRDGWSFCCVLFMVFASILTVVTIAVIGDSIVTLNHPEASLAKDTLELLMDGGK